MAPKLTSFRSHVYFGAIWLFNEHRFDAMYISEPYGVQTCTLWRRNGHIFPPHFSGYKVHISTPYGAEIYILLYWLKLFYILFLVELNWNRIETEYWRVLCPFPRWNYKLKICLKYQYVNFKAIWRRSFLVFSPWDGFIIFEHKSSKFMSISTP